MPAADSERAPSSRREAATQERIRRVVEAAGLCFSEVGVQATTMDRIAEVAGVSKPFVYRYFEGKEALADAVIREALKTWRTRGEVAADETTGGAAQKLAAKVRACVEFSAERPVLRAMLRQDRGLHAGHARHFGKVREESLEHTRRILARGVRARELRRDVDVDAMARAIEILTHGVVLSQFGEHVIAPADGLVDAAVALVEAGVRR